MKFNQNILFISSPSLEDDHAAIHAIQSLKAAIISRGFSAFIVPYISYGIKLVKRIPKHSAVGIFWDTLNPDMSDECQEFITEFRVRNSFTPIFLLFTKNITDMVPLTVLQEISEYICLFAENPGIIASRICTLVHRHAENLLSSNFKTHNYFTEDGDFHWSCQGRIPGGNLKHHVSTESTNFFDGKIMRDDNYVATPKMGDFLTHAEPSKQSEDIDATLFGASFKCYDVSGSSGSNRNVVRGAVVEDEIAIVDCNWHNSLNHCLNLSRARPVNMNPTRNTYGPMGAIPTERMNKVNIDSLIIQNPLTADFDSSNAAYGVINNFTDDDFNYNANDVVNHSGANIMHKVSERSLVQESIDEAITFCKAVISIKHQICELEGKTAWFFDVHPPHVFKDKVIDKQCDFKHAPLELLNHESEYWELRASEEKYSFDYKSIVETNCMLDPVKVTITCPGIDLDGQYLPQGIPGYLLTKFLEDRRIEIACTGDYTILILFSVENTKVKWDTLIKSLLAFKKLYDGDALAVDAIPSLKGKSQRYENLTLKQLCHQMHQKMRDLDLMNQINDALNTEPEPILTPAAAQQKVLHFKAEHIRLDEFSGRIAANMLVPYPPGITLLMPGERLPEDDKGIMAYLCALQDFDKEFPGFEHEIQGIIMDEHGDYWVRAIIEDQRTE